MVLCCGRSSKWVQVARCIAFYKAWCCGKCVQSFTSKYIVKVKVKSLSRVQLFVTPWTPAYQAPPSMGFSRQECWSGLPFSSPRALPNSGIEPGSLALQADALPSEPPGKPKYMVSSHILGLNQRKKKSDNKVAVLLDKFCWAKFRQNCERGNSLEQETVQRQEGLFTIQKKRGQRIPLQEGTWRGGLCV